MKTFLPLVLFSLLPALLQAQDLQTEARHYLSGLGVASGDINRVIDIQTRTRRQVRETQLELNVLKAELEKALYPINVDMKEVQRLLDQSLKLKMKSELARIEERVELRKMLGDYKYAAYQRHMRDLLRRANGHFRNNSNAGRNP